MSVPWESFVAYPDGHAKFADGWLLTPGNVVSTFRDGDRYCRLCGSFLEDSPATHVAGHEPELHAWREEQRSNRQAGGAGARGEAHPGARARRAGCEPARGCSQCRHL
jgi:hypothetical protein